MWNKELHRHVLRVPDPKKSGARSARARSTVRTHLLHILYIPFLFIRMEEKTQHINVRLNNT